MEMNRQKPEGTFANPDVDDEIVNAVVDYLEDNEKAYPWDIICDVSESEDIPKKTVRKAIRKLRMPNSIVPAEPFVGELTLATN